MHKKFFGMFNELKDDGKYQWTNHVKDKMAYYRISPSLVKRIIRFPNRIETGVAPNTIAVMQSRKIAVSSKKSIGKTEEIWVMYQEAGGLKGKNSSLKDKLLAGTPKKRIISAWRYPGVSPKGKEIPIPEDILQELKSLIE